MLNSDLILTRLFLVLYKSLFHYGLFFCFLTQGTPADVLYKGTITRLITEDSSSRAERERDEVLSKAHVVFEGTSAQILSYDREYIHPSDVFLE